MAIGVLLAQAWRRLRRTPVFTAVAAATVAITLSVLTALASLWNGLVVQPQPGMLDARRLVRVDVAWPYRGTPYPKAEHHVALKELGPQSINLAYYAPRIRAIRISDVDAGRMLVHAVSPEYFEVARAPLAMGAGLQDSISVDGLFPAVVSWRVWHERLGSDPAIVGRRLTVGSDSTYVVAGVAAAGFQGPEGLQQADIWVRWSSQTAWSWGRMFGRLRDGADNAFAEAELAVLWRRALERLGDNENQLQESRLLVAPLGGGLHRENHRTIALLMGGTGGTTALLLLVSGANLAALVLARAISHQRDFAVRHALGAGAIALMREPVVEVLLLFLLGGTAGVVLAPVAGAGLISALNVPYPFFAAVRWDLPTLLVTAVIALAMTLLCAIGPALKMSKVDPGFAMRGGADAVPVRVSGRRLQALFLSTQIFVAFPLLTVALGAAIRASKSLHVDLGVTRASEIVITYAPAGPNTADEADHFVGRAKEAASVSDVTTAYASPGADGLLRSSFRLVSTALDDSRDVRLNIVGPRYFELLGVAPIAGRTFTAQDRSGDMPVAVVSRAAARLLLGGRDPLGTEIVIGVDPGFRATIVGVVPDIAYDLAREQDVVAYVAADQFDPILGRATIMFRSASPAVHAHRIDSIIGSGDAAARRPSTTLRGLVEAETRGERSLVLLVIVTALVTLSIALVGVFGLVASLVQDRRRDIAVRLAMGASEVSVAWMYVRTAMRFGAYGLIPGAIAAYLPLAYFAPVLGRFSESALLAALVTALLLSLIIAAGAAIAVRVTASFHPAALLRSDT